MRLGLILGRGDDEGDGIAEFHDVVDKDFDVISAGNFEFNLAEEGDVGCIERGVFEAKFHLAFSQNSSLVRGNQPHGFGKVAHAGGPAVEETQAEGDNWDLGNANEVHDADEEEISGYFLANFFAEDRALEVGKDAGGVHSLKSKV